MESYQIFNSHDLNDALETQAGECAEHSAIKLNGPIILLKSNFSQLPSRGRAASIKHTGSYVVSPIQASIPEIWKNNNKNK